MKKLIQKTNGKKTESAGILLVAFQLLTILKPGLLGDKQETAINLIISSGAISALAHRIWRNKAKYAQSVKNIFKRK